MKFGQALVELIIGVGMLGILLPALATGLITSSSGKVQSQNYQQATMLLKEELESLDVVRNAGWDNISTDGIYHTAVSGNTWTLISGTEPIIADIFTRSLTISSVERLDGEIVASGGVNDPSTKKVEVIVSWDTPRVSQVSAVRYFTRYQDNFSSTPRDTTQAHFDAGTLVSVATTNDAGGEVVLSGGGHGDWCQPSLTQWGFDLSHNASGTSIAAIPGRAFVVTGNNNASETFYNVNISSTYPPVATNDGNLTGQKKAYGVFGNEDYAYIATDTSKKQGVIIELTSHTETGWLDIDSASVNGRSIVVAGDYAYISGTNSKIYAFDVSNKTGTRTSLSNVTLTATAIKLVYVSGNLYAALDSSSNQLAIIPVSGSSFSAPQYVTVSGQNGRDVYVNPLLANPTRAYLATSTSVSQSELFVIDIPNRQVLASQDTNGMDPYGVLAVTNNKVVIAGTGGYEYQVYNYNDSTRTFSSCTSGAGLLNIDAGIRSVAAVITNEYAYTYLLTGDSASEFKIIEGGPTGQSALSGTFTSAAFDAGQSTAFNLLSWTAENVSPPATDIQFQVAVADPNPDCAGASYSFIGPDGTSGTYFTAPGAFPLNDNGGDYQNPGQCFKYQAVFTSGDISQSPTLLDVTWGYSP